VRYPGNDALRFSAQRHSSVHTSWRLWTDFYVGLGLYSSLTSVPGDKIPLLQLFAHRYRHGSLSGRTHPLRSRTVEDTVRSVGQTFSRMGSPDPRLSQFGVVDQTWKKSDKPPTRVKPLPMGIVRSAVLLVHAAATPIALATADCLILAFYFLLRPGKYTGTPKTVSNDLFRLQDVGLWVGGRRLSLADCPLADLQAAMFTTSPSPPRRTAFEAKLLATTLVLVTLLFARCCALSLRCSNSTGRSSIHHPLIATRPPRGASWQYLQPAAITGFLRAAVLLNPDLGILPSDVSARSTCAGGAMAMYVPESTAIASDSLADGAPTRCTEICTSRRSR
jgi:hypothetical protein